MSQLSDITLILRVTLNNDVEAFSRLVEKHQSALRRFFLNLTEGNKPLSDDLAQETFIKAYTHLKQFKIQSKFTTWLFRIGYNAFYDYKRNLKQELSIDSNEIIPLKSSTTQTESMDIYQALNSLNENEKICVSLFYMEDIQIKEIAKITQLPEGSIKSNLSRGRAKLAKFLKQNGYEEYR